MNRKTQSCYEHVFQYITNNLLEFDCASVMTDYEKAMRNAIRSVVPPDTELFACWFHFTQAVKKHASQMNSLLNKVRGKRELEKIYYKLQAIPLLPAKDILSAFEIVKSEAYELDKEFFKPLFNYYQRQWLINVSNFNGYCIHYY